MTTSSRLHQLRELPHPRTGGEIEPRRRRVRAGGRAHERLRAGQPADQAATNRVGPITRRQSGTLPQGGRVYRHHQSELGHETRVRAQDPAAGPRVAAPTSSLRNTICRAPPRAARRDRRERRSLVLEFRRAVPGQDRSQDRQAYRIHHAGVAQGIPHRQSRPRHRSRRPSTARHDVSGARRPVRPQDREVPNLAASARAAQGRLAAQHGDEPGPR